MFPTNLIGPNGLWKYEVAVGPAGQLRVLAPLTYPHLETLGLEQAVSGGEDVEVIQDGATAKAHVLLIDE